MILYLAHVHAMRWVDAAPGLVERSLRSLRRALQSIIATDGTIDLSVVSSWR
jgi:hypothetical protein